MRKIQEEIKNKKEKLDCLKKRNDFLKELNKTAGLCIFFGLNPESIRRQNKREYDNNCREIYTLTKNIEDLEEIHSKLFFQINPTCKIQ